MLLIPLRRILLAAGAPLLGCNPTAGPSPAPVEVAVPHASPGPVASPPSPSPAPLGACSPEWGEDTRKGGCMSGPYEATHDRFILIDTADAKAMELYEACRDTPNHKCPVTLCERVLDYKPISTQMIGESFGRFIVCAPACKAPGQPGIRAVYTVAGDCAGRRPEGLARETPRARDAIGALFASMARLEGASVFAFERLARELTAHAAPRHLVVAARSAMADEMRHYALVAGLARRFGATPTAPQLEPGGIRSLEEIAVENVVEGCVGETFGAAMAAWQAAAAGDPAVRRVMTSIARDEAEHAELAFGIDLWTSSELPRAARRRTREALAEHAEALASRVADSRVEPSLERSGVAGVDAQMTMVSGLRELLWRRASRALA